MNIDDLIKSLDTIIETKDIYGQSEKCQAACVMTGFLIAETMHQNPEMAKDGFQKILESCHMIHLLKGLVLWAQKKNTIELPAFFHLMGIVEKKSIFNHIKESMSQEGNISPVAFELLVFLCNDCDMQPHIVNHVDDLFKIFASTHHFFARKPSLADKEWFYNRFMRLFAFLKGQVVRVDFFKCQELPSDHDALKVIFMLRMARALGVLNFREIWNSAMANEEMVFFLETYCRVKGLRRIARMIWKDFNHHAFFQHCILPGKLRNLDHLLFGAPYYPPDKPCELLAHSGNLAVVRIKGKRYILMNHENVKGIIFPCKSKVRDPWQILADMAI